MYQASSNFRKRFENGRATCGGPCFVNGTKARNTWRIRYSNLRRRGTSGAQLVMCCWRVYASLLILISFFVSSELQFLPLLYTNLLPAFAEICMAARSFKLSLYTVRRQRVAYSPFHHKYLKICLIKACTLSKLGLRCVLKLAENARRSEALIRRP